MSRLLNAKPRLYDRKSDWGYNGPGVVLRVMTRLCQQMNVAEMIGDTCRGVSVLEPHRFYPVPWPQWRQLFENDSRVLKLAAQWRRRGGLGAHAWDNLRRMRRVNKNSRQIYGWLARTHCPHVYALGDDTFWFSSSSPARNRHMSLNKQALKLGCDARHTTRGSASKDRIYPWTERSIGVNPIK